MASIRRTMSPGARPGTAVNGGEACTTASPLSKTSSCNSNHLQPGSLLSSCLSSLDYAFYRAQACLFSIFSQRSSRSLERSKSMRQSWRRSLLHFFVCFFLGAFAGLTSIASSNSSLNLFSQHQAFSFEVLRGVDRISFYSMPRNATSVRSNLSMNDSVTSGHHIVNDEVKDGILSYSLSNHSLGQIPNVSHHKLLIIVTPTYARPFQAYHLNRLAHTLKLVTPPLLWIVVEMTSQSIETADLLRNAGIMYRHLVCSKNLTDRNDRRVHLLNVALAHIEIHHLDGITYFADDDNIYAPELFEQMRQISRFGTWTMGKYVESKSDVILDGPVCNGSQVIGWHKNNVTQKLCRFHADMGGFAFNSTILWNPKRWHRLTLESVRLLDTVKGGCYVSSFIEQIVEDESQMEGFPSNCSRVMVWHHNLVQLKIYALQKSAEIGSLQNGQAG